MTVNRERTANVLGALAVALNDRFLTELARLNTMTPSRAAALATLKEYPGDSIEQLATVLDLTSSGATRLVAGLVRDSLVDKRSGTDARSVAVHLTTTGTIVADEVLRARRACFGNLINGLGEDEQEVLANLCERMLISLGTGQDWADRTCRFCDYANCPQQTCPVAQCEHLG